MTRSASVPKVCREGEIYFPPKKNEVMGFVVCEKEKFEKSTPKDRKTDETISLLGYDSVVIDKI